MKGFRYIATIASRGGAPRVMSRATNRRAIVIILMALASNVLAQQHAAVDADVQAKLDSFGRATIGFDWDTESRHIHNFIQKTWKSNGWSAESDQFAAHVMEEIAKIPPWHVNARVEVMTGMLAARYGLDDGQAARWRGLMLQESGDLLRRHGGLIFSQAREYISDRMNGRLLTPEQVARWTRDTEPLRTDLDKTVDRLFQNFGNGLSQEQRRILDRDRASAEKRMAAFERDVQRWTEGQWEPGDWGMDESAATSDAMVAAEAAREAERERAERAGRAFVLPSCANHDPDSWVVCALDFKKKYALDAGQRTTVDSLVDELAARARQSLSADRATLDAVPYGDRAKHPGYESVRKTFSELQDRMGALLTSAQREKAERALVRPSKDKTPTTPTAEDRPVDAEDE